MLTEEVIKKSETLATLTPDQIQAVTELSKNDEAAVLSSKLGEYEATIEGEISKIAGVAKNSGEKPTEYLKRTLSSFKTSAGSVEGLTAEIAGYKTTIKGLETKIAAGQGNEVIAQKLADAESKLLTLQSTYETDKTAWEKEKTSHLEILSKTQIDQQFDRATEGIKFKAGYTTSAQQRLLSAAKSEILTQYTPDWVEEGGTKIMVLRGANKEIARNPANLAKPYTIEELIKESLKEDIEAGTKKPGGGTGNPKDSVSVIDLVDLSTAKTQLEADELIVKHLLQKGELRGSASFAETQKKIREEYKISTLPIK